MRILAVETSCDETALALVEARGGLKNPRFKIFKNLVASQIKIHQPYGGVVPNLAKREHLKNLPILIGEILKISNFQFPISKQILNSKFKILNTIDLIAVTVGPGLEPCLWTGINFSREIYRELTTNHKQPTTKIIGVSHLEGHLYSFLLSQKSQWSKIFPAISLVVSGGHTNLLLMKDLVHYKKLGETRDDAVGECFDKVARLLGLNYPGGPEIEKLAQYGNPKAINFPRPMINQKNYDFSFSGLKTAVLYYLRDSQNNSSAADIAASFQAAAFDVLINKTIRAVNEYKAKSVIISGGVASNKTLQKQFKSSVKSQLSNVNFFAPAKKFCTDNAVMIAVAGYLYYLQGKKRRLVAQGGLTI
jgi:N6-L-threonylcarbamoyladenine synthase